MNNSSTPSQFITAWLEERMGDDQALSLDERTSLVGDGLLDSLGFLELSSAVETQFGVELDYTEDDPEHFVTFGGYVQLCQRHIDAL